MSFREEMKDARTRRRTIFYLVLTAITIALLLSLSFKHLYDIFLYVFILSLLGAVSALVEKTKKHAIIFSSLAILAAAFFVIYLFMNW